MRDSFAGAQRAAWIIGNVANRQTGPTCQESRLDVFRPLFVSPILKNSCQAIGHQRCTASAVSNGPVLKQMRACGACS